MEQYGRYFEKERLYNALDDMIVNASYDKNFDLNQVVDSLINDLQDFAEYNKNHKEGFVQRCDDGSWYYADAD